MLRQRVKTGKALREDYAWFGLMQPAHSGIRAAPLLFALSAQDSKTSSKSLSFTSFVVAKAWANQSGGVLWSCPFLKDGLGLANMQERRRLCFVRCCVCCGTLETSYAAF
jgi:hypothetical protein